MRLGRSVWAVALIAGTIIGVGVTASLEWERSAPAQNHEGPMPLPVTDPGADARVGLPDFTVLVDRLEPSIVNISTVTEEDAERGRRRPHGGGGGGDPFEFFFGPPGPRRSLGSGFVLDEQGYIITNHHVVEDATKVVVRLKNDKEYQAKVIGTDAKTDIAVIRIEGADGLVPVPLGDSEALRVGEWVIAIGNPFGLDHTVTAGIVSGKGRRLNRPDQSPYDDFIQTDAAINPGNSGGPLVNMAGQVVGINSAIFSRSGGNIGIGFAIPINLVRGIVPQLKEHGSVIRGWLGVMIQPVDEDIAKTLDLPGSKGALVAKVFPDSPASEAGIEVGDVIVLFDRTEIAKSTDLPSIVANTAVGKSVEVVVIRGGSRQKLEVKIAKLEDEEGGEPVKADKLGLSVQDVTPEVLGELDLPRDTKGVVVSSVVPGSPADEAGLRTGDLIQRVGNNSVASVAEFRKQLSEQPAGGSVLVLVRRGDQTLFRVIKPAAAE